MYAYGCQIKKKFPPARTVDQEGETANPLNNNAVTTKPIFDAVQRPTWGVNQNILTAYARARRGRSSEEGKNGYRTPIALEMD